jgi:Dyp-type peroxidase family
MLRPDDVQRLIPLGSRFDRVRHYFLRVESASHGRAFISEQAGRVTTAASRAEKDGVALALTYPGMQALELPTPYLDAFQQLAPAYYEGAAVRGAAHLGDTGRNESPRWEMPFQHARTHVLLSVYADDEGPIDHRVEQIRNAPSARRLSGWDHPQSGAHIGTDKEVRMEHFGFRDGISQPGIRGMCPKEGRGKPVPTQVAAGEFLLGHANAEDENLWGDASIPKDVRAFAANGCFVAFRKMQQHVETFMSIDPLQRAKMCGRWPSGARILPGQMSDPANGAADNSFDFSDDRQGLGCPYGSHVRRMNPRTDPVTVRTPAVIRRGMPYAAGEEKGLFGLFLCASLERQFEFLLRDWVKVPPMNPQGDVLAADPLIGGEPRAMFRIPPTQPPGTIAALGTFVTTRGTLYGFYPSISALKMIGQLH